MKKPSLADAKPIQTAEPERYSGRKFDPISHYIEGLAAESTRPKVAFVDKKTALANVQKNQILSGNSLKKKPISIKELKRIPADVLAKMDLNDDEKKLMDAIAAMDKADITEKSVAEKAGISHTAASHITINIADKLPLGLHESFINNYAQRIKEAPALQETSANRQ